MLRFLYPRLCYVCRSPADNTAPLPLCSACYDRFRAEIADGCPRCGRPLSTCDCHPRLLRDPLLLSALPYRTEGGVVRRLILTAKHHPCAPFVKECAFRLATICKKRGIPTEGAYLTYVPRSPKRYRSCGFDQARELARALGKELTLPVTPLLTCRPFAKQQKTLSFRQRSRHAAGNYRLRPEATALIQDKTVLLVDDVVTTGATLAACVSLLQKAGASQVICLTAARTVSHREDISFAPPSVFSDRKEDTAPDVAASDDNESFAPTVTDSD